MFGWDGQVQPDLASKVEAVDVDFCGVDCGCRVGVLVDGVDVEGFEGCWAMDGEPVDGIVLGDFEVLGKDKVAEGFGR